MSFWRAGGITDRKPRAHFRGQEAVNKTTFMFYIAALQQQQLITNLH